jgi:hypothetical protein
LQLLGNKARTGAEKRSSASMQKAERIWLIFFTSRAFLFSSSSSSPIYFLSRNFAISH